jgi:hypothetical protein
MTTWIIIVLKLVGSALLKEVKEEKLEQAEMERMNRRRARMMMRGCNPSGIQCTPVKTLHIGASKNMIG